MFAGVAACSMPTVHQFFTRQNFSLITWTSSLKASLTHLLSGYSREKLPDHNPSFTEWGGSNTHTSVVKAERFRMKSLEPGARVGDSQIHLTQDISIT